MKKIAISALLIVTLLVLTSCQMSRTAITADEFKSKAEAAGFTIQDSKDQFEDGLVADYLIAFKGDVSAIDYKIEFLVLPTVDDAKVSYNQNQTAIEAKKGNFSSYSSLSLGNYSVYTQTSNGKYSIVSRTDNTLVYIDADEKYKGEISEFLKTIGY